MNWLFEFSWWQIALTFVFLALVIIFLVDIEFHWSTAQSLVGNDFILMIGLLFLLFLVNPALLWFIWKEDSRLHHR